LLSLPLVVGASRAAAAESRPAAVADAPPAAAEPESRLDWLGRSLGFGFAAVFLCLTLNLVALVVASALAARRANVVPPDLIREVEIRIDQKRLPEACDLARRDPSLLGQVVAAGLAQFSDGYSEAAAAMQVAVRFLSMKVQQRLGHLRLIAKVAVLLGFVGTVQGLIGVFDNFARQDVTSRPAQLGPGLGSALVALMVGLWIAIVAVVFHHFFGNRMDKSVAEVGILAERLLKRAAAKAGG
jgi:biopolymer transport protein ExbB